LTREARAGDPDVSRAGVVVCTVQFSDRRALATFPMPTDGREAAPDILMSEPGTDYGAPRWSPDSRLLAAERRRLRLGSQIVLIDPANRTVRVLADVPGGRSAAPTWTPDGRRVLFSAAVGAEPFRIYAADVASGELLRLDGTGASAQSPDVSPDGATLVFVGYTADGYDLFSMSLAQARWASVDAGGEAPRRGSAVGAEAAGPAVQARGYSAWRTLVPQFWTPTIESDADELVVGAATGSVDALGRHAYGVEVGWANRARPDWQLAYAYDRWWPTVFLAISDDTDPWRLGEARTREADVGLLLRASRVRSSHTTMAAFHVARDAFACQGCTPPVASDVTGASLRAGWELSSAKSFGYSISAEEGGRLTLTAESTRTAFGADGNGFALTGDLRRYWRAGPRHAVIAVRGAAAGSWGDAEAERRFSASGAGPQAGGFDFGADAIGLLRGFDQADVTGTRAVVVNADLRVPLLRVDRGAGTIPVFLRSIHGALFADVGNAWSDPPRWSDLRMALGAELSMDTVIGFALPVTLTMGGAWRRDGARDEHGFAAFGRIGRAF
jgi:hypothetical protein